MFEKITLFISSSHEVKSRPDLNFSKLFALLGIHDTPKRRENYFLSRYCLQQCLSQRGISLKLDELILENHQQIYGLESLGASLSHTKDYAAAALFAKQDQIKSVGVDIELATRELQDRATKYFINEKDQLMMYNDLEKWVIKEACYKAASNFFGEEFLLKDLYCDENSFYYQEMRGYFKLFPHQDLIVALAYVPNQ